MKIRIAMILFIMMFLHLFSIGVLHRVRAPEEIPISVFVLFVTLFFDTFVLPTWEVTSASSQKRGVWFTVWMISIMSLMPDFLHMFRSQWSAEARSIISAGITMAALFVFGILVFVQWSYNFAKTWKT